MSDTPGQPERAPVVVTMTDRLTRQAAQQLVHDLESTRSGDDVVIDLTDITGFDSEGTQLLLDLQETLGSGRLRIVGMHQAAARLIGAPVGDAAVPAGEFCQLGVTRLHNTAVVQAAGPGPVGGPELEEALAAGLATDTAIVVVDVRNCRLDRSAFPLLAFASSDAAVRGRQLLVVNLGPADAERLRSTGLSGTTYVAPEVTL